MIKTASAKDLRLKTAALLREVRRGREIVITYRGRTVAVLSPVGKPARRKLTPVGFGMWKGRRDMRSVEQWLKRVRDPRYRG
jgi:prevent-host-death family protein